MEFQIKLSTVEQIRSFINKVERYNFPVDLKEGRYIVDAKSIMGIFSLDLSKELTLNIHSDDCADFLDAIKKYIVK